jgi:AraC-like DNA-binding protein
MIYQEYPTHPALRPYVRCYITVEELHTEATQEHRFLPERSPKLLFYDGTSSYGELSGSLGVMPNGHLTGLITRPLKAVSLGLIRALQVDFYPWGAMKLFGLKRGLQDTLYGADELKTARLAREVEGLLSLGDFAGAIAELEAWLLGWVRPLDAELTPAIKAALRLYESGGQAKVTELAEEVELSLRQLERGFQKDVGIAPKMLAKLIRFEEACNQIWRGTKHSLTELAFDLGYADQAHFTREFKSLAYVPPSWFARLSREGAM